MFFLFLDCELTIRVINIFSSSNFEILLDQPESIAKR